VQGHHVRGVMNLLVVGSWPAEREGVVGVAGVELMRGRGDGVLGELGDGGGSQEAQATGMDADERETLE